MVDLDKVAYSQYFGKYIQCVKYIDDNNWEFIFPTDKGLRTIYKAKTPYSFFSWNKL